MSNESFYMHLRYDEFLSDIKHLKTDAKINPNALNLAFDVWILQNTKINSLQNEIQKIKIIVAQALEFGAIGERGEACMSIDGGNL